MQWYSIGVTTRNPYNGPLLQREANYAKSDQVWYVMIKEGNCTACHHGCSKTLQWDLDHSPGNSFACAVLEKGELHLYHNGRDVGVAWEGLPIVQPLWEFVSLTNGWKVETNYIISTGKAAYILDQVH